MRGFSALTLAQITSLNKKIEERNKQAAKIEKSIKVAKVSVPMPRDDSINSACNSNRQDNWHPALQDLVTSIGKRFSEAFDRASAASLIQAPSEFDLSRHWMCRGIATNTARRLRKVGHHNPCEVPGYRAVATVDGSQAIWRRGLFISIDLARRTLTNGNRL